MEMYKWDPWWEDVPPFDSSRKAAREEKEDAPVSIEELRTEYIIRAKVPQFRKEEIKVTVDHGLLRILAEHDEDKGTGFAGLRACHCSMCRSFSLPEKVDARGIKATLEDGKLKLEIPRTNGSSDHEVNVLVH